MFVAAGEPMTGEVVFKQKIKSLNCAHVRLFVCLFFSACSMLADDLKLSSDDDDSQKVCSAFSFPTKVF